MARALIHVPASAKKGDVIEIKTLISHVMETGYRIGITGSRSRATSSTTSSAPITARKCSAPSFIPPSPPTLTSRSSPSPPKAARWRSPGPTSTARRKCKPPRSPWNEPARCYVSRGLLMRAPSPQRGEGWGEGAPTSRSEPPHPALSPLGRGRSERRLRLRCFRLSAFAQRRYRARRGHSPGPAALRQRLRQRRHPRHAERRHRQSGHAGGARRRDAVEHQGRRDQQVLRRLPRRRGKKHEGRRRALSGLRRGARPPGRSRTADQL